MILGVIPLKATVAGTRDKFESGQTDEFAIETAEIGDLKKIKSVLQFAYLSSKKFCMIKVLSLSCKH